MRCLPLLAKRVIAPVRLASKELGGLCLPPSGASKVILAIRPTSRHWRHRLRLPHSSIARQLRLPFVRPAWPC